MSRLSYPLGLHFQNQNCPHPHQTHQYVQPVEGAPGIVAPTIPAFLWWYLRGVLHPLVQSAQGCYVMESRMEDHPNCRPDHPNEVNCQTFQCVEKMWVVKILMSNERMVLHWVVSAGILPWSFEHLVLPCAWPELHAHLNLHDFSMMSVQSNRLICHVDQSLNIWDIGQVLQYYPLQILYEDQLNISGCNIGTYPLAMELLAEAFWGQGEIMRVPKVRRVYTNYGWIVVVVSRCKKSAMVSKYTIFGV